MTLEELNKIDTAADWLIRDAKGYENAAAMLADLRNGEATLADEIMDTLRYWTNGSQKIARNELFAVLNSMAPDIIRIAELRLAAAARQAKVSASSKKAAIAAYCGGEHDC